jgi:hypothetical protein
MFTPHVFGIMVGQPLEIVNDDTVLHNLHAVTETNRPFNVAQPVRGMRLRKSFSMEERRIRIKCDVHPWMSTWCFAMGHPFFAVSDRKGRFEIAGVPPGEYGIAIWHERFQSKGRRLRLAAGQIAEIAFRLRDEQMPRSADAAGTPAR